MPFGLGISDKGGETYLLVVHALKTCLSDNPPASALCSRVQRIPKKAWRFAFIIRNKEPVYRNNKIKHVLYKYSGSPFWPIRHRKFYIVQNAFMAMEAMTPVPCKEAKNQRGALSHIS